MSLLYVIDAKFAQNYNQLDSLDRSERQIQLKRREQYVALIDRLKTSSRPTSVSQQNFSATSSI